jgi:hypothetical protein
VPVKPKQHLKSKPVFSLNQPTLAYHIFIYFRCLAYLNVHFIEPNRYMLPLVEDYKIIVMGFSCFWMLHFSGDKCKVLDRWL